MIIKPCFRYLGSALLCLCLACSTPTTSIEEQLVDPGPLFTQLDARYTRIHFVNKITETSKVNFYYFDYMYNGGGVAIGDLNNDGLSDIYFTSNMGSTSRCSLPGCSFRKWAPYW